MKNYIIISLAALAMLCGCRNSNNATTDTGDSTVQFAVRTARLLCSTRSTDETTVADVNYYLVDT